MLWRDASLSLPEDLLDEVGDIATSNGNVLNAASNDVAFSLLEEEGEGDGGEEREGGTEGINHARNNITCSDHVGMWGTLM